MDGFLRNSGEAAPNRRFRLRDATAFVHQRLETLAGTGGGASGLFASPSAYLTYLRVMQPVRARLERQLDVSDACAVYGAWPKRRIASLLAADLLDLGGSPEAVLDESPTRLTDAEVLGCLYVLEGSALGARLLARAAAGAGLSAAFGARHLHAQAGSPEAWRSFVAILDAADLDAEGEAACARAAAETFGRFADAYDARLAVVS